MRKLNSIVAVLAAVVATVGIGATSAVADPIRDEVSVGAQTTTDIWNRFSNGIPPVVAIASYNAFGTDQIIVDASNTAFARPWGDRDGVFTLSASLNPAGQHVPVSHSSPTPTVDIAGKVDVARSFSGPATAGSDLTYVPAFRDAITLAIVSPIAQLTNLTTAEESALYTCTSSGRIQANGAHSLVRFNDGAGHTQTLRPILPVDGLGTRTNFQSAIGVPNAALGPCVSQPGEWDNDGRVLVGNGTGTVQPFAVAQYIGQANGIISPNTTAGVTLLNTNGIAPMIGTAPTLVPGPLYGSLSTPPVGGIGTFAFDEYDVVSTSAIGTPLETEMTTDINTLAARTIIATYGFGILSYIGNHAAYLTGAYTN